MCACGRFGADCAIEAARKRRERERDTVGAISNYLDDYEKRHPEWDRVRALRKAAEFFAAVEDVAILDPISMADCDEDHSGPQGVNEDIGSCPKCWGPVGVLRPDGESFGWHLDDCSLPITGLVVVPVADDSRVSHR